MFGGLNRLFAAVLVAGAVLVLPPAALARGCNGDVSAINVYKECFPGGGGGKPAGHSGSQGSRSGSGGGSPVTSGPTVAPPVPISSRTKKKLKQAGADGKSLKDLVQGYGDSSRLLQSSSSAPATEPSAVGSAFDLGSGPTALLIVLAGTAVLLLGASGFRGLRQRRR